MPKTIESYTIDQIKEGNQSHGWYFFNPEAVAMFESKIESDVFNTDTGVYFITSEILPDELIGQFSVRQYIPKDGHIRNISIGESHDLIEAEYPGDLVP